MDSRQDRARTQSSIPSHTLLTGPIDGGFGRCSEPPRAGTTSSRGTIGPGIHYTHPYPTYGGVGGASGGRRIDYNNAFLCGHPIVTPVSGYDNTQDFWLYCVLYMYLFCICIILYYFHLPESWFSAAYYVLYSIIIIRVLYLYYVLSYPGLSVPVGRSAPTGALRHDHAAPDDGRRRTGGRRPFRPLARASSPKTSTRRGCVTFIV